MAKKYTSIGGQALIEGIMMKSPEKTAIAVRTPDKSIDISYLEGKSVREKYKILKLPIIRGVVGFVESMMQGYKALMISAEKSGFADELDDKPKSEEAVQDVSADEVKEETNAKPEEKKNNALLNVVMVVGAVLGVVLALALFMYLPRLCVSGFEQLFNTEIKSKVLRSVIEQTLKMTIFVGYVVLVSLMNDIKRVYMYHGAEHKTIFCYEKGLELTVENVRPQKRFHPRCGTSFMILMILVSVVLSTLLQVIFPSVYSIPWLWTVAKVLMVPLTCGIGFEVLKVCGRFDNIITRIISAPGMWLQRVTTKEPTDDMIEIAIAALKACEPEVPDVDRTGCCNDNF